jgi:hypothetical protein
VFGVNPTLAQVTRLLPLGEFSMVLVSFEDTGALRKDGYVCVTGKIADGYYNVEYRGTSGTVTRHSHTTLGTINSLKTPVVWRCSR